MTLLVAQGLCKNFGGVKAATNVGFTLEAGEMLAVIGPNGAGKSTTFNMVGGQLKPDSGTVSLSGDNVTGVGSRAMWRKGVGRTFQVAQTFGSMTVVENVQMALLSYHNRLRAMWPYAGALYRTEALALLDQLGMLDDADRACASLAYGDVKRVELAIALASDPKLLLMDEPTAGMAPQERAGLMALTARIARERRIGVLFTEHDMDSVFSHADRILVLVRGEVIAIGKPQDVRNNARVKEVYLGETGVLAAERAHARSGENRP